MPKLPSGDVFCRWQPNSVSPVPCQHNFNSWEWYVHVCGRVLLQPNDCRMRGLPAWHVFLGILVCAVHCWYIFGKQQSSGKQHTRCIFLAVEETFDWGVLCAVSTAGSWKVHRIRGVYSELLLLLCVPHLFHVAG